ncbi:unnamed protein product [Gemmataceae bacterium]|nr:unnamed protein product [Gemmataceae bacterium]VTU00136.1 unnamed protein product [Gemmataceae bacterium]
MVEMFERHLRESPYLFTPSQAARERQHLEWLKVQGGFMARIEEELERYDRERRADPTLRPVEDHLERFQAIMREWNHWDAAWRDGRVAPMPREVTR